MTIPDIVKVVAGCLVIVLLASWLICTFLAWVETVDDDEDDSPAGGLVMEGRTVAQPREDWPHATHQPLREADAHALAMPTAPLDVWLSGGAS